jgi:hypothetical protein
MFLFSFPKIPHQTAGPPSDSARGSALWVVLVLSVLFTALGLGLLHFTRISLKASGFRKNFLLAGIAAENGSKKAVSAFLAGLRTGPGLSELSEPEYEALAADFTAGRPAAPERLTGLVFPSVFRETWENLHWESRIACHVTRSEDRGGFILAMHEALFEGRGGTGDTRTKRTSRVTAELAVRAGHIPLSDLPFFLNRPPDGTGGEDPLERLHVTVLPPASGPARAFFLETGEPVIPSFPAALLESVFKARIFRPQDLSPAFLRPFLGLESSPEPIPNGVYLIRDDLGLGGVFVQGDLESMILAVDGEDQLIAFRSEDSEWLLRFDPAAGMTTFSGPAGEDVFELVPRGMIICNGKIGGLSGGCLDASGELVPALDETVPAVRSGLSLTIVASDEIRLSGHLTLSGVEIRDGLPYYKEPPGRLVIYAAGQDFLSGEDRTGGIVLDAESSEAVHIHASLAAGGAGFTIRGQDQKLEIFGGLQASDLTPGSGAVKIVPDERPDEPGGDAEAWPRSAVPLLSLSRFRILLWEDLAP